ncbi:hypothetical protein NIES267_62210 [Calothrix parasitica NIES-267]|uniref:Uncharacterized protein n=1 Tax=Calothrix parasitica NIES-267 TaxID=1973488 RepID=A0A1Z4LZS8_9CYAN|nr:hypothetical protein NIES267_62210 [Calothrix parasitica NIES-267]
MTKPENTELIAQLETAITGLNKYGWDFPFGTLIWEINKQGEFSIEKLFNFEVIPENKIGFGHQQYLETLFNLLHTNLLDFTIYNFSFSAPDASKVGFQEPLITETNYPTFFTIDFDDLIISQIPENYWIGIIKLPNIPTIDFRQKESLHYFNNSSLTESTKAFLNELENLLSKRYNDYIFEIYSSREGVLARLFNQTQIICVKEFDGFEQRLVDGIENYYQPTKNLSEVLQNNLIQVKEYNIFNYYVYFIGQTHWGDWAGVWTQEYS